jgi:predicted RNA-binding protein with PUA domain
MSVTERDPWPRELWWCENPKCNEPTTEDPCQFCGEPVERYRVVRADTHQGAVSLDDPRLIETLARVIENRHGTLHGIGSTLREALAELKREEEPWSAGACGFEG